MQKLQKLDAVRKCLERYTNRKIEDVSATISEDYPNCIFLNTFFKDSNSIHSFVHIEGILFKTSDLNIYQLW